MKLQVCSTAGELVQVKSRGLDVHLTAPVDVFNVYTLEHCFRATRLGSKAQAAARASLKAVSSSLALHPLYVQRGGVPCAGMGTSTADTIAAALIHAKLAGYALNRKQLAKLISAVERSDGISYNGICLVERHEGRLLGVQPMPSWKVLIVVPKTRIATEDVEPYCKQYRLEYDRIFDAVSSDISEDDLLTCIDLSASLNARVRSYAFYSAVKQIAVDFRADAVGIAHTGSLVTLFFRDRSQYDNQAVALARSLCSKLPVDALIPAEFTAQSWRWCAKKETQTAADAPATVLAAPSSASTSTALST
ncbi:MAG: hypothetical protein AAF991_12105 [Pseudomonadota bacterium]